MYVKFQEEGLTTQSSILPGESPWTEEPGSYSPWSCKESDTTERLSTAHEKFQVVSQGFIVLFLTVIVTYH